MELQNTSGLEDSSWKCVNNGNPLRGSQTDFSKDASYLRLSLGEFFGQRSEALGCLGGGGDVKRVRSCLVHILLPLYVQTWFLTRFLSDYKIEISK